MSLQTGMVSILTRSVSYCSSNKTKYAGLCVVVSQSRVGYETRHKCVFQVEV